MRLPSPLPAFTLLAFLALSSGAAAADPGFTAKAVTGVGTFALRLEEATWAAAPPADGWRLEAAAAHLKVIDDQRVLRIPNPLDLGDDFVSRDQRVPVADDDFTAIQLDILAGQPDAIVLGLGGALPLTLHSFDALRIAPTEEGVIERSHAYGPGGPAGYNYEYRHPAGPALTLGLADLPTSDGIRLYIWGANLTLRDGSGATQTFRTGSWTEGPADRGTKHFAHAILDLQGVAAPLRVQDATAYAGALALEGTGDLVFHAARGALDRPQGTLVLDGDTRAQLAGGAVRLSLEGAALHASTDQPPDAFTGAVVWQPRPFPWLPITLAVTVAGALYALPAVRGLLLVRHATPRTPRHLRSEAYAHWASRAQMHDWVRLAAWLEGRAVRNAPTVGDFRTEHAILLRQAGRLDAALKEHRRAHDLLATGPDGGYLALNAFHAALAGAEAGRDAEAVRWLQAAIEADRGLVAELHAHPTLRRLASHPDYGAVTT